MKKIKRHGAVYGIVAVMLCVAVYLNWSFMRAPADMLSAASGQQQAAAEQTTEQTAEQTPEDYFAASRLSREQARDEAVGILKTTSESEQADAAAREQASAQIAVLADQAVREARIESMICAKGYADAVVMIGESGVNVVIASPEAGFSAADATIIRDIVTAETDMAAADVKIVEAS